MIDYIILAVLILYGIIYFKKNYVIIDMQSWDTIQQVIETYNEQQEEEQSTQELAGGCGVAVGFGADYLEDEEEE